MLQAAPPLGAVCVHQQLSFDVTYLDGTTYSWGYEVAVNFAAALTVITSVASDFAQTVSDGPSTLDKSFDPAGSNAIHEVKDGAAGQCPVRQFRRRREQSGGFGKRSPATARSHRPLHHQVLARQQHSGTAALMGAGLFGVRLVRRRRKPWTEGKAAAARSPFSYLY